MDPTDFLNRANDIFQRIELSKKRREDLLKELNSLKASIKEEDDCEQKLVDDLKQIVLEFDPADFLNRANDIFQRIELSKKRREDLLKELNSLKASIKEEDDCEQKLVDDLKQIVHEFEKIFKNSLPKRKIVNVTTTLSDFLSLPILQPDNQPDNLIPFSAVICNDNINNDAKNEGDD